MIPVSAKNQVIPLSAFCEILLRIINDMVCADGESHLQISCATNGGDFSAERFRNLHRESTDTAPRTINQHFVPRLYASNIPKRLQCGQRRHRCSGCLLERYVNRLHRQSILPTTHKLGKTSLTTSVNLIA